MFSWVDFYRHCFNEVCNSFMHNVENWPDIMHGRWCTPPLTSGWGGGGGIPPKFWGGANIFQLYVEKVNMSTVDRGFLTPLFYEDPPLAAPFLVYSTLFQIFSTYPHLLVFVPCFLGLMCDCATPSACYFS